MPDTSESVIGLELEGPGRQSRWSIGFRALLAIPHFLYLALLTFVGFFAVIAAWFAAVVLGRVPDGLRDFIGRILQQTIRVYGYTYLLTDRYPPFSLQDDYPVSVLLPQSGRLNRAAVLFRAILVVPVILVMSFVSSGLSITAFFFWIIALVKGRLPKGIFEAVAVVQRYIARVYGYLFMLTPTYPSGLFGDGRLPALAPPVTGPADDFGWPLTPEDAADSEVAETLAESSGRPPRINRFDLSRAAKRIVVLMIVVGVLSSVGTNAVTIANLSRTNGVVSQLDDEYLVLGTSVQTFQSDAQSCAIRGGVDCLHGAVSRLANAFVRFERRVESLKVPSRATGAAGRLVTSAQALVVELRGMAATSDQAEYQGHALVFQREAQRFDERYRDLRLALGAN
ncbi:MAG: DUF4389 domain-containing protein [Acidobacteria bacterium]|nr:DUF4389 domain-containing protein [Acidobacteriota bacterium]